MLLLAILNKEGKMKEKTQIVKTHTNLMEARPSAIR